MASPLVVSKSMNVYPMRVGPNIELVSTLKKFVQDNGLNAAFIVTCAGSVKKATLRFAFTPDIDDFKIETFESNFEILSLTGSLSPLSDDFHLHVTLCRRDGSVFGGHVVGDLITFSTAEIILGNCPDVEFYTVHEEGNRFRQFDPRSKKSDE